MHQLLEPCTNAHVGLVWTVFYRRQSPPSQLTPIESEPYLDFL